MLWLFKNRLCRESHFSIALAEQINIFQFRQETSFLQQNLVVQITLCLARRVSGPCIVLARKYNQPFIIDTTLY